MPTPDPSVKHEILRSITAVQKIFSRNKYSSHSIIVGVQSVLPGESSDNLVNSIFFVLHFEYL